MLASPNSYHVNADSKKLQSTGLLTFCSAQVDIMMREKSADTLLELNNRQALRFAYKHFSGLLFSGSIFPFYRLGLYCGVLNFAGRSSVVLS